MLQAALAEVDVEPEQRLLLGQDLVAIGLHRVQRIDERGDAVALAAIDGHRLPGAAVPQRAAQRARPDRAEAAAGVLLPQRLRKEARDPGRVAPQGLGGRRAGGRFVEREQRGLVGQDHTVAIDGVVGPDGQLPAHLGADLPVPLDLRVVAGDHLEIVGDALVSLDACGAADDRRQERRLLDRSLGKVVGVGFDVAELPEDGTVCGAAADRAERRAERLVVEHAAVDEVALLGEGAPPSQRLIGGAGPLAAGRGDGDRREGARERGGDAGEPRQRVVVGVARLEVQRGRRAMGTVLEGEEPPVLLDVDHVPVLVDRRVDVPVDVGAGHEQIELLDRRRVVERRRLVVGQPGERFADLPLVIAVAVEQRFARRRGCLHGPQEVLDASKLAPERRDGREVLAVGEGVGEEDPIHPPRRAAADDVDAEVDVGQLLDQAIDAVTVDGAKELVADSIDVDRQRHAPVHHEAEADLQRLDIRGRRRGSGRARRGGHGYGRRRRRRGAGRGGGCRHGGSSRGRRERDGTTRQPARHRTDEETDLSASPIAARRFAAAPCEHELEKP